MAKKVDLHALHYQVLHYFDAKEDDLQRLRRREKALQSEETESVEDQLRIEDELCLIEGDCKKLADKIDSKEDYKDQSEDLLEQHDDILPRGQTRIIGDVNDNLGPADFKELTYIIGQFVGLAQQFIKVTVKKQSRIIMMCASCCVPPVVIKGKTRCPNCDKKIKIFETNDSIDGQQDSNIMKSDYYRSETFEDIMAAFQGKQRWTIPQKVWQCINLYCKKYRLDEIQLTKEDIYNILKSNGLSDHYIDINYIAWVTSKGDISLPNIAHLEDRLLMRHRIVEEEFELVKDLNQKNFMRGQYVLWVLLQMENFICNMNDFKMLETRDVILRHDKKMRIICDNLKRKRPDLNWNFKGLA